ncbi:MAG: DNA-binding protein Alba [Candidatus Micrarchaeota archaeon]
MEKTNEQAISDNLEAAEKQAPAPRSREPRDNKVYVGKQDVMTYVLAVVSQFNHANVSSVTIKARGKAISTAVDVTQIVKNRFISSLKITDFKVETEELQSEDGSMRKVSSVTLVVSK